jgi:hypothetical protein
MSYFDNFFITLILCVGAGFATDHLNKFMKGGPDSTSTKGKEVDDDAPTKPLPAEPESASEDEDEEEFVLEPEQELVQQQEDPVVSEPTPSPQLMESVQKPQLEEDVEVQEAVEVSEVVAEAEEEPPVMMEVVERIECHPVVNMSSYSASSNLLGDDEFMQSSEDLPPMPVIIKKNEDILDDIQSDTVVTNDLLADIHPATSALINQDVDDLLVPKMMAEPVNIDEVAKTSLEEHEQELANLLKEAQKDSSDEEELGALETRTKDEGDPWLLDEREPAEAEIATNAGESLVHLDSEELPNQDDLSHCAVFGDENNPDDVDLDDDEKVKLPKASTGSSVSSSSSSEGCDEPVLLDMKENNKVKDEDDQDDDVEEEAKNRSSSSSSDSSISNEAKPDLMGRS